MKQASLAVVWWNLFICACVIGAMLFRSVVPLPVRCGVSLVRKATSRFTNARPFSLSTSLSDQHLPNDSVVASFYRFIPLTEDRINEVIIKSKTLLSQDYPQVKGTLLIAHEGVNGQFCLPIEMMDEFSNILCRIDNELFAPIKLNVGLPFSTHQLGPNSLPFKKLLIKHRREVLTDQILDLDWADAGPEVAPADWHNELLAMQVTKNTADVANTADAPILLDCRNGYESRMGTFAGAVPLDTERFGETWDKLGALLANERPNRRILTFCTGGIRCVKVNAYLKQKMGFTNIGRLEHGIIAYERWLATQSSSSSSSSIEPSQSMFQGDNFLFDRRRLQNATNPDASET